MVNRADDGTAYGVVSMNSLESWVFEEFFNDGVNVSYEEALAEAKSQYGDDFDEEKFNESYECDEENYTLEVDGLKLELSHLGGAEIVWVLESPETVMARECSPCCPNAGDLNNKVAEGGVLTFDLPAHWYRKG